MNYFTNCYAKGILQLDSFATRSQIGQLVSGAVGKCNFTLHEAKLGNWLVAQWANGAVDYKKSIE